VSICQCGAIAAAQTSSARSGFFTGARLRLQEDGILNGNGTKPKWMRWRTFERLAAEHDQFVARSMQAVALKFGLLVRDFRD
jgi:hypothetical protein